MCGNAAIIAAHKQSNTAAQRGAGNGEGDLRSQSKAGARVNRAGLITNRELSPISKNMRHLSKTVKQRKDLSSLKGNQNVSGTTMPAVSSTNVTSPDPKGTYNPLNKVSANFSPIIETAIAATPIITSNKAPHCTCLCKCFGFFRYDEWPNLDTYVPEKKL